jgi:hypothetical protein
MAQSGGYLPLAPGVSTVRYPIPQRTFKYVATVQVVTDEMCQLRSSAGCSTARNYCAAPSATISNGAQNAGWAFCGLEASFMYASIAHLFLLMV